MELEQEAVMVGEPAVQRVIELLRRRFQSLVGQSGQFARIAHPRDHRLDHPTPIAAHDVADHRIQLDVGLGQRLLDTLDVPGLLAHQLLAGPHQGAQLVLFLVRDKARLEQPEGGKVRQPRRILHVRLAAGNSLDVGGIDHNQLERAIAQYPPDRHPIDPGRLHRDQLASTRRQPFQKRQQPVRRRVKSAVFPRRLIPGHRAYTPNNVVLVNIQSSHTLVKHFHDHLR